MKTVLFYGSNDSGAATLVSNLAVCYCMEYSQRVLVLDFSEANVAIRTLLGTRIFNEFKTSNLLLNDWLSSDLESSLDRYITRIPYNMPKDAILDIMAADFQASFDNSLDYKLITDRFMQEMNFLDTKYDICLICMSDNHNCGPVYYSMLFPLCPVYCAVTSRPREVYQDAEALEDTNFLMQMLSDLRTKLQPKYNIFPIHLNFLYIGAGIHKASHQHKNGKTPVQISEKSGLFIDYKELGDVNVGILNAELIDRTSFYYVYIFHRYIYGPDCKPFTQEHYEHGKQELLLFGKLIYNLVGLSGDTLTPFCGITLNIQSQYELVYEMFEEDLTTLIPERYLKEIYKILHPDSQF